MCSLSGPCRDGNNVKSYNAGILTVLSNRIGDVALLMVIAWMLNFGRWNYIYYLDFLTGSFEINKFESLAPQFHFIEDDFEFA
jgi:hypothetical protein